MRALRVGHVERALCNAQAVDNALKIFGSLLVNAARVGSSDDRPAGAALAYPSVIRSDFPRRCVDPVGRPGTLLFKVALTRFDRPAFVTALRLRETGGMVVSCTTLDHPPGPPEVQG